MKLIENIKQYLIYLRKRKEIVNLTAYLFPSILLPLEIRYEVFYSTGKREMFGNNRSNPCPKWLIYYQRFCNYVCETLKVDENNKIMQHKKEYFRV